MWVQKNFIFPYKKHFLKNNNRSAMLRNRFFASILLAITILGSATLSFSPLFAATDTGAKIGDQALAYTTYYAMVDCIANHDRDQSDNGLFAGVNYRITETHVKSGQWYTEDTVTSGSYLNSKTEGTTGHTSCNNVVKTAISLYGYSDGLDLMCSFVGNRADGSSCKTGNGDFGGISGSANRFKTTIGNKVWNGQPQGPAFKAADNNAANYLIYQSALMSGCSLKASNNPAKDFTYTDIMTVSSDGKSSTATYEGVKRSDTRDVMTQSGGKLNQSCADIAAAVNKYAPAYKAYVGANPDKAGSTEPTSSPGVEGSTSCAIPNVGWIICPLVTLGAGMADQAFKFIADSFLQTSPDLVSTAGGTYQAWQGMLAFANIIFVIIFLIIIFSQATGYGISNYGIKKMLPKLIVGVVLINISYFICQLAVDVSNILGYGLDTFFKTITETITNKNSPTMFADGNDMTNVAGGILAAAGGVGLGILLFNLGILIPVLIAALVALLMIFLILIARQAIIVIAVVMAPIAFAAWLLPNTERFFKQWWKILSSMLLLFPIVALVFGASRMVSAILSTTGNNIATATDAAGGTNVGQQLVSAAVLILPLFAVPFLLRGALNAVPVVGKQAQKLYAGATNNSRKQSADKLSPWMASRQAKRQAGLTNALGFSRIKRDDHGNFVRDENGNLIGKNGKPARRTISQAYSQTKRALGDDKKSYEEIADVAYEKRALDKSRSIAGQAIRRTEQQGVYKAEVKQGFEKELTEEKVTDTNLRRADQRTQALGLSTRTAQTERLNTFARDLSNPNDESLLNIAQGTVNPDKGRRLAQSFATEAILSERKKNVEGYKTSVTAQVRADSVRSGMGDLDLLEREFNSAAADKDADKLSAVGELMLRQGSAGYDRLDKAITDSGASFVGSPEAENTWRDFSGHMVDTKGGDLKVRRRDTLNTLFLPRYDAGQASAIKTNPGTYTGLTAKEKATQTASVMQQAVAAGGINLTDARSILLEDGLVQEMNTDQINAIASAISLANKEPATQPAAQQTAMLIQEGDTYPRFSFELRNQINAIAGRDAPNFGGKARLQEDQVDPNSAPTSSEQASGANVPGSGNPAPGPGEGPFKDPSQTLSPDNAPYSPGSGYEAGGAADDSDGDND